MPHTSGTLRRKADIDVSVEDFDIVFAARTATPMVV
jgi:hypothetical protein